MSESEKSYWAMEKEEVLKEFEVDPTKGLSEEQINKQRELYGPNVPFPSQEISVDEVLKKFVVFSFVFVILSVVIFFAIFIPTALICGIYSIAGDNGLTLTIITLSAIILVKIYQIPLIFKMKKSLKPWLEEKLKPKSVEEPKSTVLREGKEQIIPRSELVPGDILVLSADNPEIPADARLLESNELEIHETFLTGSAIPEKKDASKSISSDAPLGERPNMIYAWTTIAKGSGKGLVVTISDNMEVPKISQPIDIPTEAKIGPLPKYPYLKVPKIISLALFVFFFIVMILSWVTC
ncbi:MAG: P-type ATPase [Promethearchaeota archaeon]